MTAWRVFIERPQQQWLRKLLFQIHLWAGIGLGLYIVMIGVTGAALVFREEIQHATEMPLVSKAELSGPAADPIAVAENVVKQYPGHRLASIVGPSREDPTLTIRIRKGRDLTAVQTHPITGKILGSASGQTSFLRWLQLLHFNLLFDRTGRIVNGVGGLFLLILCLTGMIIWWPGIKAWRRGLRVDFRRQWKTLNWDLHSATGFWALSIISMWAITGAYFAWPTQFQSAVNWFSPVSLAQVAPPAATKIGKAAKPDLRALLADAKQRTPGGQLITLSPPTDSRGQIRIVISREHPPAIETSDYHYYDPQTGDHSTVWHRGVNQSLGDLIMAWIVPLHFGTFGGDGPMGVAVKVLWVILGLTPPLLAITGFLMYWNRYLSKKWAKLNHAEVTGVPSAQQSS